MPVDLITINDLREFKTELLEEIKKLLKSPSSTEGKKYLKSSEVKRMLQISSGTLQNLRINGTLPFTKIGGVLYYDTSDIHKILEQNKVSNQFKL